MRGINDRADGTKSTADGTWQPVAATNAAAFTVRLADELIKKREVIAMDQGNGMKNGGVVNNFASGQVGTQAAHVTGSTVWMGAVPQTSTMTGLVAELAALREHLMRERSSGELDDATYEAAQAELDIASEALEEDTSEGKSAFVLALK